MFKVNNKNTKTTGMSSSGVFIVNFEYISHLFLVFLLLNLIKHMLAGRPTFPSNRNYSIDWLNNSTDWFLHSGHC